MTIRTVGGIVVERKRSSDGVVAEPKRTRILLEAKVAELTACMQDVEDIVNAGVAEDIQSAENILARPIDGNPAVVNCNHAITAIICDVHAQLRANTLRLWDRFANYQRQLTPVMTRIKVHRAANIGYLNRHAMPLIGAKLAPYLPHILGFLPRKCQLALYSTCKTMWHQRNSDVTRLQINACNAMPLMTTVSVYPKCKSLCIVIKETWPMLEVHTLLRLLLPKCHPNCGVTLVVSSKSVVCDVVACTPLTVPVLFVDYREDTDYNFAPQLSTIINLDTVHTLQVNYNSVARHLVNICPRGNILFTSSTAVDAIVDPGEIVDMCRRGCSRKFTYKPKTVGHIMSYPGICIKVDRGSVVLGRE